MVLFVDHKAISLILQIIAPKQAVVLFYPGGIALPYMLVDIGSKPAPLLRQLFHGINGGFAGAVIRVKIHRPIPELHSDIPIARLVSNYTGIAVTVIIAEHIIITIKIIAGLLFGF